MSGSARAVALRVALRVERQGAYANRALEAEAARAGLTGRDLALATALAFGTVQRRRTLDHLAARYTGAKHLEHVVRAGLRLGLLQLFFLDRVPRHAAVGETVGLVKSESPGGAKLVNAVLRRAADDGPPVLPDETAAEAAIAHSVPDWLAKMWWAELGADEARALLRVVNQPPEQALRVNPLAPGDLSAVPADPAPGGPPEALLLRGPWDAFASAEWAAGSVMPQSRASMEVAREVDPQPGERVLDLCAAPGGKTTHLAALMGGEGHVTAVEHNPERAVRLRETVTRMCAGNVEVVVADAAAFVPDAPFDRVLVDPPCSGLGTLRSRPDLRWRVGPDDIAPLAALQADVLAAGERALKPGGRLVYSVCTLSRREEPDRPWEAARRILPHREGTEGFFIGRLTGTSH